MELVQPIRDKQQIEQMKTELLKTGYKNYMLFVFGINTGLRVTDILELKVKDVKENISPIKENKTGKNRRLSFNQQFKDEIDRYTANMSDDEYFIPSQMKSYEPMSRVQAYRILKKAANIIGIPELGTHTMRKTFGYWYYKKHKDVAMLQRIFNHSSPSITLEYIGITQDMIDKSLEDFYL